MSRWNVWSPERGQEPDDGREIDAYSAQSAATVWAQFVDATSADYTIASGTPATVHVQAADGTGPIEVYSVMGEAVPSYSARKIGGGR